MSYPIINNISKAKVPKWGNEKKFIGIHFLGVVGENYELENDGCGAHFTIFYDGTIHQRCSLDAIVYAVGTAGYYKQKHPVARNANTISIEMCVKYDGKYDRNKATAEDPEWYFTKETQEACVQLVKKLMKDLNIPVSNVLRHYDIVNKTCPAPYVKNNKRKTSWTWQEFKAKLAGSFYRVRKSWEDSDSQIGAYEVLDNAKKNCPVGYNVYDEKGKIIYSAPKTGTQAKSIHLMSDEKTKALALLEIAKTVAPMYHMFPSVIAGQAVLESGYCSTDLALNANNVLGMKADLINSAWSGSMWDQKSIYNKRTAEQKSNGEVYYIYADFRKYDCLETCMKDICAFFTSIKLNGKYKYTGITDAKNYKEQTAIIKNCGYATDIKYDSKVNAVIEKYGLNKYDKTTDQPSGDILPDTDEPWYRVGTGWKNNICDGQIGAYHDLKMAKECSDKSSKEMDKEFHVFDQNGKIVYTSVVAEKKVYAVQCGAFKNEEFAKNRVKDLKKKGFEAIIHFDGTYHWVQVGVFTEKKNAERRLKDLIAKGYNVVIR